MKKFLKTVGNYAGDYGRFLADNALSTFGATDVIKASDYKTKLGKATNKFTETVNPIVGQVAAGVIGGPTASKAVGQMQSGINNATSNQVDPMARQMQQNASAQNFLAQMQPTQTFTPTFKCGGSLKKMQDGGSINDVVVSQAVLEKDGYRLPDGTLVSKAEFNKYKNIPLGEDGMIQAPHKGAMATDYHPFRGMIPEHYFANSISRIAQTNKTPEEAAEAVSKWRGTLHPYYSERFQTMDHNLTKDMMNRMSKPNSLDTTISPRENPTDPNVISFGYKYGGKLNSYNMGGQFEEYNGQSHQGPNEGVDVGPSGSPTAQTGEVPVAKVEGKETRWQDYIFSASIKVPNTKETFADRSKKITKRYELRLGKNLDKFDPIDSEALETEMMALMGAQEALKTPEQTPMMKNGGKLPKYQGGGRTGYESRGQATNPRTNLMASLAGVNNITPMQSIAPVGPTIQPMGTQQPNLYMIGNRPNTEMQRPTYSPTMGTAPVGAGMATKMSQGAPTQMKTRSASVAQNTSNPGLASRPITEVAGDPAQTNQELYQGGINPLALAAPVAGNIVGMIGESRRRNVGLNLGRVAPQQINMEPARAGLRNQAASARLANRAAMQQSGATAGNYMAGNLAGNVSTQRAAGEALANTYMGEQQFNAQARAQADAMNLQNQGQEAMFGAQQNLAGQGRMNQYRDAISTNVGQYFAEDQRSRQNAQLLGLMSDNYQYTQSGPWYNRRINKRLAETNATQRV